MIFQGQTVSFRERVTVAREGFIRDSRSVSKSFPCHPGGDDCIVGLG